MSFITDRVRLALIALSDNRRRTLLSILGVATGIVAVTTVAAIGRSGNQMVYAELESFGLSSVWVDRDRRNPDPKRRTRAGSGIDTNDYANLRRHCCPNVRRLSAVVMNFDSQSVRSANRYSNARIRGVDSNFLAIDKSEIGAGRGMTTGDVVHKRKVALIGSRAAEDLFAMRSRDVVGKQFYVDRHKFLVVGLLDDKDRSFLASIGSVRDDENNRILIPYTTYQKILGHKRIHYLHAEATSLDDAKAAGEQIIARLKRSNSGNFEYQAETMSGYIATANRILGTVELVGVIAASISLIVGGLGIMNIMSTAVVERTREIGIRKAVGARRGDILLQFLSEAVIVGVIGGTIGVVLGYLLSYLLTRLFGFPLITSSATALLGFAVSFAVGLLSGLLPAQRAARLAPVAALRYQ